MVSGDRGFDGRGGLFPGGVEHHVVPGREGPGRGVAGAGGGSEIFGGNDPRAATQVTEATISRSDSLGVASAHESSHSLSPALARVVRE